MKANIKHGFEMMKSPAAMDKWRWYQVMVSLGDTSHKSARWRSGILVVSSTRALGRSGSTPDDKAALAGDAAFPTPGKGLEKVA